MRTQEYANQYVDDSYEISVKFDKPTSYEIATVKEIGGRLADVARRKKLKIIDVHAYEKEGNRLCVHGFFNLNKCLPNGFDLKDYVSNLLIPFFYSQSIFERTGKWPFGEYLHGDYGKFQNLLERQDFPRLSDYLLEEEGRLDRKSVV